MGSGSCLFVCVLNVSAWAGSPSLSLAGVSQFVSGPIRFSSSYIYVNIHPKKFDEEEPTRSVKFFVVYSHF